MKTSSKSNQAGPHKKYLITLFALSIILTLALIVWAQAQSVPDPGHSAGQIGAGQFAAGDYWIPGRLNLTKDALVNGSIRVTNRSGSVSFFVNETSGRVGIGDASPATLLEVTSASQNFVTITSSASQNSGLRLQNSAQSNNFVFTDTSGNMKFQTANSDRMVIQDSDGDILMGGATDIGDAKLQVAASGAGGGYAARFVNSGGLSTNNGVLIAAGQTSGTGELIVFTDGAATVTLGDIAFSGTTISYNAFTGGHLASIPGKTGKAYPYGTMMCLVKTVDDGRGQPQYHVSPCKTPYDSKIFGAYASPTPSNESLHTIFAVGDGNIIVTNETGPIRIGDKVTSSSLEGKGMKSIRTGPILGVALNDWNGSSNETSTLTDGRKVNVALIAVSYTPGLQFVGEDTLSTIDDLKNLSMELKWENAALKALVCQDHPSAEVCA